MPLYSLFLWKVENSKSDTNQSHPLYSSPDLPLEFAIWNEKMEMGSKKFTNVQKILKLNPSYQKFLSWIAIGAIFARS